MEPRKRSGPIFAAGASVDMLLVPQTTDAPILTVRLERTADGRLFEDAGLLTPAGSGSAPPPALGKVFPLRPGDPQR